VIKTADLDSSRPRQVIHRDLLAPLALQQTLEGI